MTGLPTSATVTPEDRTQQIADTLAAGPCELGGDNLRSCPICLAAVVGAIREAERAAVKRAEEAEGILHDLETELPIYRANAAEVSRLRAQVDDLSSHLNGAGDRIEALNNERRGLIQRCAEAQSACVAIVNAWRDFPIDRDMHYKREEIIETLCPSTVAPKRPKP
mgnify:CR=1 FL=1